MRHNEITESGNSYDYHRLGAVDRVLQRIRSDLSGSHSLEDLAQTAYLSPFHFHRVFRHITSATPARFLAAMRIAEAKRLLLTTDQNVTTICMRVGYSSLGTFTSQFTRHVGLSPRRFRSLVHGMAGQSYHEVLATVPAQAAAPEHARTLRIRLNHLQPHGITLIGLFESGIPQGWPAACALARGSADTTMTVGPDGDFMALAVSFAPDVDILAAMTDNAADRCLVGSYGPVRVEHGRAAEQRIEIDLRPRRPSDPPIISVAPLLAARRGAANSSVTG